MQITTTAQGQGLIPERRWFQHDGHHHGVQFYSADKFLIDELSQYITHALHAGDAAVVVATREHRDGLIQRLTAEGTKIIEEFRNGTT